MPTYARGRNGAIAGIVATTGTAANMKSFAFKLKGERAIHDVSGFGDGGNSYFDDGVGEWSFSAQGILLTGIATLGISQLSGTATIFGTVALTADNGRIYSGSARIHVIEFDEAYKGGNPRVTMMGQGDGPLAET